MKRFENTVQHAGDSVQFDFRGFGLQGLADENWGLDNVRVTAEPPENMAPAIDTPASSTAAIVTTAVDGLADPTAGKVTRYWPREAM